MHADILSIIYIYLVSSCILFISHDNGIYVATVDMAMSNVRYKLLGGGQYPSECDEDAPVPPALPVAFCRCEPGNQLAVAKQSRHPKTAGRAFYVCKWNDLMNPRHSFSFSGSMVRISSTLESGCSLIIPQSRGRTMSLDEGCLPHQIHHR